MTLLVPECSQVEPVWLSSPLLEKPGPGYEIDAAHPSGETLSWDGGIFTVQRFGRRVCFVRQGFFGLREVETREPAGLPLLDSDGIWAIQSMTKSVTSFAAAILYDRGILGVDDPGSRLPQSGCFSMAPFRRQRRERG